MIKYKDGEILSSRLIIPWEQDEQFKSIMNSIWRRTLVSVRRCHMIHQLCQEALCQHGNIAEVGVYRGGTAKLLAATVKNKKVNRTIHLFDTFEGLPEASKKDRFKKGAFHNTSVPFVSEYLADYDNITIWKGIFPNSAIDISDETFCFVHVDCDIYKSVLDCCIFFYSKMVNQGIMIFDDYGFKSCPGAKIAIDEFFSDKQESPIVLATGQCIIIKQDEK